MSAPLPELPPASWLYHEGPERRRPYRICHTSSDEGGMDSSASLQCRDADCGWMSASGAEDTEIILDLGIIVNITRISIRAHPVCAPRRILVFGSKAKEFREARYRLLGEMLFVQDIYGDLKLLFMDTRQRYIMLILSKAIDDPAQNEKQNVALEFVEICGRPREDFEPLERPEETGIAPHMNDGHSDNSLVASADAFCGRCRRQAQSGDAYCRACGSSLL